MNTIALKKSIATLITGLQYSSESDFPLELYDWGHKSPEAIKAAIAANHPGCIPEAFSVTDFFNRYTQNLKLSNDMVMNSIADRYKKLQTFLTKNAASITLWRCGIRRIGIYIVVTAEDGKLLLIKTTSIET